MQFAMKHAEEGLVRRLAAAQFSVLGIVPVVNLVIIEGLPALAHYFSLAAAADASATVAHEAVLNLLDAKLYASDGNRCLALVHTCEMVCLLVIMAAFVEACTHNALSLCRRLRLISMLLFQLQCSGRLSSFSGVLAIKLLAALLVQGRSGAVTPQASEAHCICEGVCVYVLSSVATFLMPLCVGTNSLQL